jgi:hypothetical protein
MTVRKAIGNLPRALRFATAKAAVAPVPSKLGASGMTDGERPHPSKG